MRATIPQNRYKVSVIYTKIEERSTTVCCTDINLRADKSTLTEPVQEEER